MANNLQEICHLEPHIITVKFTAEVIYIIQGAMRCFPPLEVDPVTREPPLQGPQLAGVGDIAAGAAILSNKPLRNVLRPGGGMSPPLLLLCTPIHNWRHNMVGSMPLINYHFAP